MLLAGLLGSLAYDFDVDKLMGLDEFLIRIAETWKQEAKVKACKASLLSFNGSRLGTTSFARSCVWLHQEMAMYVDVIKIGVIGLTLLLAAGCTQSSDTATERKSQQAGQPLSPVEVAGHIVAIQGAAITGDQQGVRRQMESFNESFRKSIKLADGTRRIEREAARTAAKRVDGVRSVVWLDHVNLFAIVVRNEQRSYRTIDEICMELEPLGDTLGVVVNLQSGAATNGDQLEILSRNCQLRPGERAMFQTHRQVDVIDPAIRARHKAVTAAAQSEADHKTQQAEVMRILDANTPDM